MRVRISVTVEVDPKEWDASYGTGSEPVVVREDVKRWAQNALAEHPEGLLRVTN